MANACRLQAGELIAYQDGTLPVGRQEIVEAHLTACDQCQQRLATFREVDRIIQDQAIAVDVSARKRADLRARLHEANRRAALSTNQKLLSPHLPALTPKFLVPILLLLFLLPAVTQAEFPLSHFVRFAEIEITERLPPEEQMVIEHVAPTDPEVPPPSFPVVAPLELPLGLVRVEQSTPGPEQAEFLYRNHDDVTLLFSQVPVGKGFVTLEREGTDLATVQGTDVLIVPDPQPDAVAELFWERDGVVFNIMVIEAPTGPYGGLKREDALMVVEAVMAAQDAGQE